MNTPRYAAECLVMETALAAVLVGLRLDGGLDWAWTWVLCPFWLPLALVFASKLVALPFGMAGVALSRFTRTVRGESRYEADEDI